MAPKSSDKSLALKYLEYLDKPDRGETFADFFDWVGVPIEQRNDFVVGAILKQAQEEVMRDAKKSA